MVNRYKILDDNGSVVNEILADEAFVEAHHAGRYELVHEETIPVTIPPGVVSMRQARLALLSTGLLSAVNAVIAQSSAEAQVEWEYATEVRRDWPLVIQLGEALDLDLDALFEAASKL